MTPQRAWIATLLLLFVAAACGDDGGGASPPEPPGSDPDDDDAPEPNWMYKVTSNESGRPFPAGQGGGISTQPSGSPDAPAQLTLRNAVPLYVINFFVETDDGSLPPGTYEVLSFIFQTPDQTCGDAGAESPPQMTLTVDSEDPLRGSFTGTVTCNRSNPDSYDVEVAGTFDDS